jgi:hypothetical protein
VSEKRTKPKEKEYYPPIRQDRRFRCARCGLLRDPSYHLGLYDETGKKPICAPCEESL